MENIKVLITGGGGFIGSNMIKFLKEKGYYVRVVDKAFRKERQELYNLADELIYLDLRDLRSCILACSGMNYVFHFASDMGGVGYFHAHDYEPFINNMTMDMNILQAASATGIARLFYSSSACIYPIHLQMEEGKAVRFSEDMIYPANSDQMYGWEKLMMTRLCERAPLDARVGIFHTIFGPYQETEGERMKFPTAIATKVLQAKEDDKPVEIWGNGNQLRSFCYIDDAIEKIYRVMMSSTYKGPVNIASDEVVSILDVARLCCDIVGIHPNFVFTNEKPSGVLARNADNTLFEKTYNYKNQISTKEGFERLIKWIQSYSRVVKHDNFIIGNDSN